MRVRAYEVTVKGTDWSRVVNAESASKARYRYLLDVWDSWPSVRFQDVTVRSMGAPRTSEQFLCVASYRGVDFRCGDEVMVGTDKGVIVGHNSSANFDVLVNGHVYNVHPHDIRRAEAESLSTAERAVTPAASAAQK